MPEGESQSPPPAEEQEAPPTTPETSEDGSEAAENGSERGETIDQDQETVNEAAKNNTEKEASRVENRSKLKSIFKLIQNAEIDSAVADYQEMVFGVPKEETQKRIESVRQFIKELKINGQEVSLSEEEIFSIQEIVCEPILNGHISGETAKSMVKSVTVAKGETLKQQSMAQNGYEGMMFCNPHTGEIIIAKEALTGEYKADDGSKLDIRHMILHEMSHVATEDVFFNNNPQNDQQKEAVVETKKFSNEIIQLAQQSKGERIPQSRHIETVLDMLSNLQHEFQKTGKPPEEYESFRQERESLAAKEILTDYTAIYLKSNGERQSFIEEYLNSVGQNKLNEYASSNTAEDGADAKTRVAEILRAKTPEEKAEVSQKFPEFKQAFEMYNKFFNLAEKHLGDDKIKAAAQSRLQSGKKDDDYEGYYDHGVSSKGTGVEYNNQQESMGAAVAGAIESFADEVDFTKPVE